MLKTKLTTKNGILDAVLSETSPTVSNDCGDFLFQKNNRYVQLCLVTLTSFTLNNGYFKSVYSLFFCRKNI